MKHLIVTRSSYPVGLRTQTRGKTRRIDEAFCRQRLDYTRWITAASLAAQTCRDFTWLVLFDHHDACLDERRALYDSLPFPVVLSSAISAGTRKHGDASTTPRWRSVVEQALKGYRGPVLTTRLDDDDALSVDFVERLHGWIGRHDGSRCSPIFPVGCYVMLKTGRVFGKRHDRNQFVSHLSPAGEDLRTVMDAKHAEIDRIGPRRTVDHRRAWLWFRHTLAKSPGGFMRGGGLVGDAMRAQFAVDWTALGI